MTKVASGREKLLSIKQIGGADYAVFYGDSCLTGLRADRLFNNQYLLRVYRSARVREDLGSLPETILLTGSEEEVDERVKQHAEYIIDRLVDGNFEGMLAVRR